MRWLWWQIQDRIETKATLDLEIEQQQETVKRLRETTWGILLHEDDNGQFMVLPVGTLEDPDWRLGERPAVRLWRKL